MLRKLALLAGFATVAGIAGATAISAPASSSAILATAPATTGLPISGLALKQELTASDDVKDFDFDGSVEEHVDDNVSVGSGG